MSEISWIKLSVSLPDNKKIKRIRKLPDGDRVILFWVFLLARAGESNNQGGLFLTEALPYQEEDLAADFDFTVELVHFAILTLEKYGMIEKYDQIIFIKNWEKYQAIEGMEKVRLQNAKRQAKFKAKQKNLTLGNVTDNVTDNVEVTQGNAIESESDKESELEDIDKESVNYNIQFFHDFYVENFGLISPNKISQLRELYEEIENKELLLEALKVADNYNAKSPIDYSRKILDQWNRENVKSIEDIEALRVKKQSQQKKPSTYTNQRDKVIPEPEWSNPNYNEEMTDKEVAEFKKQLASL